MDELFWRDTDHVNFVTVYRGFSYAGNKLKEYSQDRLQAAYRRIWNKCDHLNRECTSAASCSKTLGTRVWERWRWCPSCKGWAKELEKCGLRILEDSESWYWREDYKYIIPENITDISTFCKIGKRCEEFQIRPDVLATIKSLRDTFYGHNPKIRVSANVKDVVFDALRNLMNDDDVKTHIVPNDCITELNEIQKGDQLNEFMQAIRKDLDKLRTDNENALIKEMEKIKNIIIEANINEEKRSKTIKRMLLILFFLLSAVTATGLLGVTVNLSKMTTGPALPPECLSEEFTYPFRQDIPLANYLYIGGQQITGREWLFSLFQADLLNSSFTKYGQLAVAETGYGKTEIISHLLCAKEDEKGGYIRKHVVAFHVCKFDVPSTRFPEVFVRRMVGFLSTHSPAFRKRIAMLSENYILFNRDHCRGNIEACFDQGISHPLQKITDEDVLDKPWIIVIDALDECLDERSKTNPILDLLSSRIWTLPKWVKFLITTGNESHGTRLSMLKTIHLAPNDTRNIFDIRTFIENSKASFDHLLKGLETEIKVDITENLVVQNRGNFLYVTHALEYLVITKYINQPANIPDKLQQIYEVQFKRQFSQPGSYRISKLILEIVCATINPLGKAEIVRILEMNAIVDAEVIDENFEKLSYFSVKQNNAIILIHCRTLYQWLFSDENEHFRISVENGHAMIFNYFVKLLKRNQPVNVAELAIHVAESKDSKLIKNAASVLQTKQYATANNSLHQLIGMTSSVKALKVLLFCQANVDQLNEYGVTPSFVAAALGHLAQLILLNKNGANLNYVIANDDASLCFYYAGYTLLHIAAQFDHSHVIGYLVEMNSSLVYIRNARGLRASDIACQAGNIKVLEGIAAYSADVIDYECLRLAEQFKRTDVTNMVTYRKLTNLGKWGGAISQSYQCTIRLNDCLKKGVDKQRIDDHSFTLY